MRIGVVGTNFVSDMFMEATRFVKDIEITSVTSGHKENAILFADKYDIPNVFDNYIDMLNSDKIDAIYLAVPNSMHKEMAIECLNHKMPTIVEKPMASNYNEVKEIFDAASKNDTYVHDAIVPLYTENFVILKDSLSKVGKIRRAVINFSKYSSRYDAYLEGKNPTTFRKELCNGSIMDLGVYCIADAVGLFGKPNKIVANGVLLDTGVDALGSAIFSYDDFEAVITHSKVTDSQIVSEIEGEKGLIQFNYASQINEIYFTDRLTKEKTKISVDTPNAFSCQLMDFVKNNQKGLKASTKVPASLSLDIHYVVTECRKQMGVKFPCDGE